MIGSPGRRRHARWSASQCVLIVLAFLAATPVTASAELDCRPGGPVLPAPANAWEPPLDRRVSVQSDGEPLRLVLDRLSATIGIRLSYSREALPLERPVCAAIEDVALGDALRLLLAGLAIEPVPVGASHVVLAPATTPAGLATPSIVYELERLLVTAAPDAAAARHTAHAVSIIEGDELRRFGSGGFAQALNALVPGFWSWGSPAATLAGGFASMRGASSFGTTAPKVYLDGIEVANPLLLAQLTPEAVERIEVVRGPQGSALYGANAINGVISIVSRRGGAAVDDTRGELRSSAGVSRSIAGASNLIVHDHALNLRAGSGLNWARLTLSGGSDISTPGTGGGHVSGLGTGRIVHGSSRLTGTARLHLDREVYLDPGISSTGRTALGSRTPADRAGWLGGASASQYTLGATFEHYRNDRWVHTFVAGLDGYRLKPDDEMGVAAMALNPDAMAMSRDRGVDRFTLRASTLYALPVRDDIRSSLTVTAEQLFWRRVAALDPAVIEMTRSATGTQAGEVAQRSTGIAGQADVAFRESMFLTGGLRLEHTGATGDVTPLPQLGASAVARHDDWTLTIRTAYGRAMRSPALPDLSVPGAALAAMTAGLQPELQEGIEAGFTLRLGNRFSLDVTRFDQTASNLTQWIGIALTGPPHAVSADVVVGRNGGAIGMQNIGEIANRGWEVQSTLAHDRLSVVATASQVDSRAIQLPGSYAGDLRPGDRMPGVPSHTAALMGLWEETPFSVSLGLSRAWGWIDYDRERLALDIDRLAGSNALAVENLRDYWKEYNGGLGVDGSVSVWPVPRLGITLRGSNLLNKWLGGTSNTIAYHRRSAGVELRLRF